MPFPYRDETKQLNDLTRRSISGLFISLPDGVTHYELSNPQVENTVVLVHGFSVPNFIFDPTFKFLTESGFRVLRYDLFGRGYSDRPDTRYNIDLFVEQLCDLMAALRFTSPVNLIGLSMGGPITATFAARHPDRVKSLTFIDPSGARSIGLSPMLKLAKMPVVAETIIGWMGTEGMIRAAANDFFDSKLTECFIDKYRVQMQYNGFKRAILSSIRNNMLGSFIKSYRTVGNSNVPVLLIWGRDDRTVPIEHSDNLLAVMPNAKYHIIENCGHIPHYEKPDEFNAILLEFLESCHYCKITTIKGRNNNE